MVYDTSPNRPTATQHPDVKCGAVKVQGFFYPAGETEQAVCIFCPGYNISGNVYAPAQILL